MTDEEAITYAMMHGCLFAIDKDDPEPEYFVEDYVGEIHPIEKLHNQERAQLGFDTPEELAWAYCRYYRLGDYDVDEQRSTG